jgi:hypothetical protein
LQLCSQFDPSGSLPNVLFHRFVTRTRTVLMARRIMNTEEAQIISRQWDFPTALTGRKKKDKRRHSKMISRLMKQDHPRFASEAQVCNRLFKHSFRVIITIIKVLCK